MKKFEKSSSKLSESSLLYIPDILGNSMDENSNSTVKLSTEISKSSRPSNGRSGLDDF